MYRPANDELGTVRQTRGESEAESIIAAFNEEGTLFVMSSDFLTNISRFGTNSKIPPRDMVWCTEESVLLYWDGMLLLVGQARRLR